jgi:hypothetical protein
MSDEDATHLINILKKDYAITVDREAMKYIGLTVEWDYDNGKVHIHMPGYLDKAMTRFKNEIPTKVQNSPHLHAEVKYRTKKQFFEEEMKSPHFPRRTRNTSKQSQAHSYTMGGQSTLPFSRPSVPSPRNKRNRQRKRWRQ